MKNREINLEDSIFSQLDDIGREGLKRVESAPPSRDLTDKELRTLNNSYKNGLKEIKKHRWHSTTESSEKPYWKSGIKRIP